MKNFKDARRRMKQQALQTLGVAEATQDSIFKDEYFDFKNTCTAIKSLRRSMDAHLEAIRNMQATAASLTVELAAFHQHTDAAKATVAFGQAHAETERVHLASVERLFEEEVSAATELLLWQVPEVEDKVKQRKKLLLDYDAHLRKYENLSRSVAELADAEVDVKKKKKAGPFSRRKSETEMAEELTQRKVKLEQAEESVDESTKWLMEQFQDMSEKRQNGTILEGPMSALLACQLHLMRETAGRLESIKPHFESADLFAATLKRYDKEPPKIHAFDVEGVANITNLNATVRRKKGKKDGQGAAFGLQLSTSTPPVLCDSIAYVRAKGLDTEGIFRIPGEKENVDLLKARYDAGDKGVFTDGTVDVTVHDVCTLLKMWLRDLPEPVIPTHQYEKLMEIIREDVNLEKPLTVNALITFTAELPQENKEVLGFLCSLLDEAIEHEENNKMNAASFATCFAPTLMRAPAEVPANEVLKDMQAAIAAVRVFIENASRIPKPTERQIRENTFVSF